MKKTLIALIGSFTLAAALPALAGPDWQTIEKARQARQATAPVETSRTVSASGASAAPGDCPVERLALPLDHGPRAQATPHQNQIRKQQHEEKLKACAAVPR